MQISPNTNLSEWSETWIKEILDNDEGEGLFFDFKEGIDSKKPDHDKSLRRTAASFANTFGGFIIFGIKDKNAASSWDRLCGVKNTQEFAKRFTDKLSGGKVIPSIFFEGPKIIEVNKDGEILIVLVVKIPTSELKPFAIQADSGLLEFWIRGNTTAVPATYPHIVSLIEESGALRNLLAALYLDTRYIDVFSDKMKIPENKRETDIPVLKISGLINSEQSVQIAAKIPTDLVLIQLIWGLRQGVEVINSFREMMINRQHMPLTNSRHLNKRDNSKIDAVIPEVQSLTKQIRAHLTKKYPGIREWLSVTQASSQ